MRELYTLELMALVRELRSLEGFYIDQFYELDRGRFRMRLSGKGTKANVSCTLPYSLCRTDTVEIREEATNFSIAVRKRIKGARIKAISQLNCDRIISIGLSKGDLSAYMILEMFGRGNLVITDTDMKIQLAYVVHDFKDRSVRPGSQYMPPKNSALDICNGDVHETLVNAVDAALGSAGSTTVMDYMLKRTGIGRMYVEEAICRSRMGVGSKVNDMKKADMVRLFECVESIIGECLEKPMFTAYMKDGNVINLSLCKISKYEGAETKEFSSLETMLDFAARAISHKDGTGSAEMEKIEASISKQERILEGIDKEIESNKKAGDYIMGHMGELNSMVHAARSKKSPSVKELQESSDSMDVIAIDMKRKAIRIKAK
ncbi:MAG: NFACT family protein [Candidatus Micrarchaeaceae archaeon]